MLQDSREHFWKAVNFQDYGVKFARSDQIFLTEVRLHLWDRDDNDEVIAFITFDKLHTTDEHAAVVMLCKSFESW